MTNLEYAEKIMAEYPDVSEDIKNDIRKLYIDDYTSSHKYIEKIVRLDMDNG